MFSKLSIKVKLVAAFLGVASLLLVVGAVSWYSSKQVVALYDSIPVQNLANIKSLSDLRYQAGETNRLMLRAALAKKIEEIQGYQKEYADVIKAYDASTKQYLDTPFMPGEEEIYNRVAESWKKYQEVILEIIRLAAIPEKRADLEKTIYNDIPPLRKALIANLGDLVNYQNQAAENARSKALETASKAESLMAVVIAFGFILAGAVGFFFATALSKALGRISEEISSAADQTSASGSELSSASQQLSSGSSEAASSLEETVASLEELSSMVKVNADHAREANNLSQASSQSAQHGENEISKLISAMGEIAQGSKKIEEIINVIDDIAFQTNLLALNAAVEAARAGEQGKGFAVVAEAVRNLAQKSAEAAKDINSLIKENVEKSVSGAEIASQSGVVLKDIVTSVKKVADLNSEISTASQDQANGIEQISKAMNQLDQATQGNAASSEEVAASSEELSSQANVLASLVVDLQTLVHGHNKTIHVGNAHSTAASVTKKAKKSVQASKTEAKKPSLKVVHSKQDLEQILPMEDSSKNKVGNVSGF